MAVLTPARRPQFVSVKRLAARPVRDRAGRLAGLDQPHEPTLWEVPLDAGPGLRVVNVTITVQTVAVAHEMHAAADMSASIDPLPGALFDVPVDAVGPTTPQHARDLSAFATGPMAVIAVAHQPARPAVAPEPAHGCCASFDPGEDPERWDGLS
jgi:hypothetical protein